VNLFREPLCLTLELSCVVDGFFRDARDARPAIDVLRYQSSTCFVISLNIYIYIYVYICVYIYMYIYIYIYIYIK